MFAAHRSLHIRPWILDECSWSLRENTWNLWWDRCVLNLSIDSIALHCFELREEEERRQPQRYRKIPVLQRLVRRRQCLWLIQEAASSNGFHVFFILVHYVFDVVLPSCSHMSKYEHLWQSDLEGGEAWQFTPLMQSLDHDAPTLRQR